MENRLTSLKAGAQPSGGDPAATAPTHRRRDGGSKVSEATAARR